MVQQRFSDWMLLYHPLIEKTMNTTPSFDEISAADPVGPTMIESAFVNAAELRLLTSSIAGSGLRSTGSSAHARTIEWIEQQMLDLPGISVRSDVFEIQRWQPLVVSPGGEGRSLSLSGGLSIVSPGTTPTVLQVAGAVPYSLPTSELGTTAKLVHVPPGEPITVENAQGKIILREIKSTNVSFEAMRYLSYHMTDDLAQSKPSFDRPHVATDTMLGADLVAAGLAGAAGMIVIFNFPTDQVEGYFEPHRGTHFAVPAVFVGADEGAQLIEAAQAEGDACITVRAERDLVSTRNLIATLPGQSDERIILCSHTDGNTWVQENGSAGLIALARYFSSLPIESRPRTIEFMFGTAHLHISKEGVCRYAKQADAAYEEGKVAFALAIEHLGTRELLPTPRIDGPGQTLAFTGRGEPMAWFAGNSRPLISSSIAAVERRELDHVMVMRGQDIPDPNRVPTHVSFGGIGTYFHRSLIPTIAIISGPWSLWASSFGEDAIDFDRMRSQLLAVGDVVLTLSNVPREEIAGHYLKERMMRASGFPTYVEEMPPEQAPSRAHMLGGAV